MMLAGEMVLTRNALLKKAAESNLDEMVSLSERVDAITSELQDGVMATRMQPVGLVFTRFRRIVRDLARPLRKEIELVLEGEEVELDQWLIEAMGIRSRTWCATPPTTASSYPSGGSRPASRGPASSRCARSTKRARS